MSPNRQLAQPRSLNNQIAEKQDQKQRNKLFCVNLPGIRTVEQLRKTYNHKRDHSLDESHKRYCCLGVLGNYFAPHSLF